MSQNISSLANQLCQQVVAQEIVLSNLQQSYNQAQSEIVRLKNQLSSQIQQSDWHQQYESVNNLINQKLSDDQTILGNSILHDVQSIKRIPFPLFRLICSLLSDSKDEQLSSSSQSRGQRPINDGRMLEIHIGILMKAMNYKIVECGGSRGDQGVDIRVTLTTDTVQSHDAIIQCKQYSGTLIQADRARELLGSMLLSQVKLGILISSDRISEGCRQVQSLINNGRNEFNQMRILLWESFHLKRLFGLFSQDILNERDRLIAIIKKEYSPLIRQLTMSDKSFCINHFLGGKCDDNCLENQNKVNATIKSLSTISISNLETNQMNETIKSLSTNSMSVSKENQMSVSIKPISTIMLSNSSDNNESDNSSMESLSDDDDDFDVLTNDNIRPLTSRMKENISNFQTPKSMKLKSASFIQRTPLSKAIRKWTKEEEIALSHGVSKYNHPSETRLWKKIASDPEYGPILSKHPGLHDLKDKWRSMQKRQNSIVEGDGRLSQDK